MKSSKTFLYYTLGQAVNALLRFILIPYYSRVLSVEEFGQIGILWLIIPILTILSGWGASVTVPVLYYKYSQKDRMVLINFSFINSIIIFMLIGLFFYFFYANIELTLNFNISRISYIDIVIIGFSAFFIEFFLGMFRITFKPKKYILFNTLYTICSITLIIFFIVYLKQGVNGFIQGTMYSNLLILLILCFDYFLEHYKNMWVPFQKNIAISYYKLGLPVVIGFSFTYLINYSGRYILKDITNYTNVGLYTMGTRIGEVFNLFFVTSYMTSVNPVLLKSFSISQNEYKVELKKYLNLFILIAGLLFLFCNSFLSILFNYFIDLKYINSIRIVQITFFSYIIIGVGQMIGITILAKEKIHVTTIFSIIAGIMNVVLNYLLVPRFEVFGTVISSLFVYFFIFIVYLFYSNQLIAVKFEFSKIFLYFTIITIIFIFQQISTFIFPGQLILDCLYKLIILFIGCMIILKMKIFAEIHIIQKILQTQIQKVFRK